MSFFIKIHIFSIHEYHSDFNGGTSKPVLRMTGGHCRYPRQVQTERTVCRPLQESKIFQIQIITMHQSLPSVLPQQAQGLFRRDSDPPHSNLPARIVCDSYNIVLFKGTRYRRDSYRKNAGRHFTAQSRYRRCIQLQYPFGKTLAMGNPFLDTRHITLRRDEAGT